MLRSSQYADALREEINHNGKIGNNYLKSVNMQLLYAKQYM